MPTVSSGIAPTLKHVLGICRNMILYLYQCDTNFLVITGPDGEAFYTSLVGNIFVMLVMVCKVYASNFLITWI